MSIGNAINGKLFTYISPTIDLKATGLTSFFTTLTGSVFIPIVFTTLCDTQTLAVGTAFFNIGWTAADYSDFELAAVWDTIIAGDYTNTNDFGGVSSPVFPSNTLIRINVTSADAGTALTGRLIIAGYYI